MINAILEITIMLLGSFGIGLLAARQFWMPKLRESQGREEESHSLAVQAEVDYRMELKKITDAREQSQKFQKDLKYERDKLDGINKNQTKTIKKLESELETLNSELESLKEKNRELKRELKNEGLKPVDQNRVTEAVNEIRAVRGQSKVPGTESKESKEKVQKKPEPTSTGAYYEVINGRKYDKAILDATRNAVAGQGDGRISVKDAEKIYKVVDDANQYTEVEKDTLKYIRDNFQWTDASDQWFRKTVRSWAAKRGWESVKIESKVRDSSDTSDK